MTTNKNNIAKNETPTGSSRGREKRVTKYVEIRETDIPEEVQKAFLAKGYSLRFVRYYLQGQPDYKYLNRREREGYEFVQINELPDWYQSNFTVEDDRRRSGLLVSGDVVLCKVPVELLEDRRRYMADKTSSLVNAVNINVLQQKGYVDLGSKSSVNNREPRFGE